MTYLCPRNVYSARPNGPFDTSIMGTPVTAYRSHALAVCACTCPLLLALNPCCRPQTARTSIPLDDQLAFKPCGFRVPTAVKPTPQPCVLREEQAHQSAPHLAPCEDCHALAAIKISRALLAARSSTLLTINVQRYHHQDTLNVIHQSLAPQLLSGHAKT
jgi:hypothetical protein